ncbi:MAG: CoA activase [bacterium]|nr:MAG: CoA activase [bacterium]
MSHAIGICLGATTISTAERSGETINFTRLHHEGRVGQALRTVLADRRNTRVGITGRKFRKLISVPTIAEPEAVELAYGFISERYPGIDSIVSAGGESFIVYSLDGQGSIRSVHTGNKCASGTGEFFLQQIQRMGLTVEDAVHMASDSEPYNLASRCSVFCKSDCTHAMNKGAGKGAVAAGLCRMLAVKIVELLRMAGGERVLVIGGVGLNSPVVDHVRTIYPHTHVPEEAPYFEALGALIWAGQNPPLTEPRRKLARIGGNSFPSLPPLKGSRAKVSFRTASTGDFYRGEYILGLDVGSTTTKAVLVRTDTKDIVASRYLRTNGDPVGASRSCYEAILRQVPAGLNPRIIGLGVTGSGRQIAALHALTDTVVNEIVAHASAAVHFDPEVDTIFEIGGQDAKYTFLTNGVPTDYAMNEACSAGTGSFLEEACRESFGIETEGIADIALGATAPPNFNDQCAAFIGSDVKTAVHEGIKERDIVAGLVYSVCQNYLSRVRGNRRTGRKIFMQGGVCHNRAVPVAMAVLCEQEVIVPPAPGLMGAFGAALETAKKIEAGLAEKGSYDLEELAARHVRSLEPFVCGGGRERCDRKCTINRYAVNGKVHPFGGACDRYYNIRMGKDVDVRGLDLVRVRDDLMYGRYVPPVDNGGPPTVGIPGSLLANTLFPLYARFFQNLGLQVLRSTTPDPRGMEAAGSAFCLPVLHSHGYVRDLLDRGADRVFVPQVCGVAVENSPDKHCTCPLIQSEPYVLNSAFHSDLSPRLLTEVLDLNRSDHLRRAFEEIGIKLGYSRRRGAAAFDEAWGGFLSIREEMKEYGRRFLSSLPPEETAVVLFGRSYNAFSSKANMGIPAKFASRGYRIIPYDFLPVEESATPPVPRMYWASGQTILQTARYIQDRENLFGVYVTNFSCGPDSFIIEYFRDIMGDKPFLTLELDAHTADAGVDTRIEAFLDVVRSYRELNLPPHERTGFSPARTVVKDETLFVQTGTGERLRLTDQRVHVLVPSMGDIAAEALAAALRYTGVRASAAKPPGPMELTLGKMDASCKECLPLILTTGSLRRYLRERQDPEEVLVYFMPEANGPCRFGQYSVFLRELILKNRLENLAVMSPSCEDGYAGLPALFPRRALMSIAISDGLEDIRAGVLTLAADRREALEVLARATSSIISSIESDDEEELKMVLAEQMAELSALEKKQSLDEVTKVTLTGEIYVRRDGFSRHYLVEKLADAGVLVRTAPVMEWILYVYHSVMNGLTSPVNLRQKFTVWLRDRFARKKAEELQEILVMSGFFEKHPVDIKFLLDRGKRLIDPRLTGEAILTVSSTLAEIGDEAHGVISMGPFGCMPCRIAESIIGHRLVEDKPHFSRNRGDFWTVNRNRLPLPFLALETDGNAPSQLTETRLESFILSAHRLKRELSSPTGSDPE